MRRVVSSGGGLGGCLRRGFGSPFRHRHRLGRTRSGRARAKAEGADPFVEPERRLASQAAGNVGEDAGASGRTVLEAAAARRSSIYSGSRGWSARRQEVSFKERHHSIYRGSAASSRPQPKSRGRSSASRPPIHRSALRQPGGPEGRCSKPGSRFPACSVRLAGAG